MASIIAWLVVACAAVTPVIIAASSPYIEGREVVYVLGAMGGIIALSLMFVQPLLAGGYLPALKLYRARRWHRVSGALISISVLVHIAGLYLASPMDMTDALLLSAPTAFSIYGVIALWSLIATLAFIALRTRLNLALTVWKLSHNILAAIVVITSVTHALMIEGLMGEISKIVLCILVLFATVGTTIHLRVLKR